MIGLTSTLAYIGLGSNLGDRRQYLIQAVHRLHGDESVQVMHCSSIYETAPVGLAEQPYFLNMVISIRTNLQPVRLLRLLLDTERSLGRVRDVRWGPRTIDLDLLLFGGQTLRTEELELPHPRLKERAFVLVPLMEILQPDEELPEAAAIRSACDAMYGKGDVQLWQKTNWRSESGRFGS